MISILLFITSTIYSFSLFLPQTQPPKQNVVQAKMNESQHSIVEPTEHPTIRIPSIRPSPRNTPNPIATSKKNSIKSTPRPTSQPKPTNKPIHDSLFIEVNSFRQQHNKGNIASDFQLCDIAQARINELVSRGSLDNHEGFPKYVGSIQKTYKQWWEVIHSSTPAWNPRAVVYDGWANSSGHREALISSATHGCGKMEQGFAVYVLGEKK